MNTRAQQLLAPPFATLCRLYPGTALCAVLALAGSFLAEHYGAPALMLVLLLGFGFANQRSEEHTSELQSLMRISYAVFCLKKKTLTLYNIRTYHYIHNSQ